MSERRTDDATLIAAVRILARTIHSEDGVIPACLAEAAARLETLVEERRGDDSAESRLTEEERQAVAGIALVVQRLKVYPCQLLRTQKDDVELLWKIAERPYVWEGE